MNKYILATLLSIANLVLSSSEIALPKPNSWVAKNNLITYEASTRDNILQEETHDSVNLFKESLEFHTKIEAGLKNKLLASQQVTIAAQKSLLSNLQPPQSNPTPTPPKSFFEKLRTDADYTATVASNTSTIVTSVAAIIVTVLQGINYFKSNSNNK
jgi:hypothetical protein